MASLVKEDSAKLDEPVVAEVPGQKNDGCWRWGLAVGVLRGVKYILTHSVVKLCFFLVGLRCNQDCGRKDYRSFGGRNQAGQGIEVDIGLSNTATWKSLGLGAKNKPLLCASTLRLPLQRQTLR